MEPDQVKSSAAGTPATRRVSSRKRRNTQETATSSKTKKPQGKSRSKIADVKSRDVSADASRPTPQECYYVTEALSMLHPHIVEENDERRQSLFMSKKKLEQSARKESKQTKDTPVTDAIIGTMLSQNTTDANCHKAFATLKKDFPGGWDQVANVEDITLIEQSTKVAGLAKTRAQRIQGMLQSIQKERGEANFEYLQTYESNGDIIKELSRFKGMGPKTISCVLLFALGRNDFPVDTHVLRITQQMGWVSKSCTREGAYEHFKTTIPGDCMMDLHCLLVQHGKVCYNCAANGRPQFPPEGGKANWVCPLVGIKSGKMPSGGSSKVKAEEITSGVKIKLEKEEPSADLDGGQNQLIPDDTISGEAIKVLSFLPTTTAASHTVSLPLDQSCDCDEFSFAIH